MNNILIINAHHQYPFAEGRLNGTLVDKANSQLTDMGHTVRVVNVNGCWDIETELENHTWSDTIILQSPVNWMGVPWTFKKYMDEVYTAGMSGALTTGDGRTEDAPKANYGAGGTLTGKKYMLSLTFNAPEEAFNDHAEYLFQGKSVDDLFFPMHMNFRFFGMDPIPTFACYDVMKNAQPEKYFEQFASHLSRYY